jgi:hypothetical protein
MELKSENKKRKDFLLGLSGKKATGLGLGLYLISRFVFGGDSGDMLIMTLTAMLELAGVVLFIGGLYRWYKETKTIKNSE